MPGAAKDRFASSLSSRRALPILLAATLGRAYATLLAAETPPALPGNSLPADDYIIDVWQTSEGLPMNTAWCALQTRDGYLWFGTGAGLARFDGVRFVTLNHANTPALPDNGVQSLYEDRRGRFWVGTANGLAVQEHGQWKALNLGSGLPGKTVRAFAEDAEGSVWIGTDNGLSQWQGGRIRNFGTTDGLPNANVRSLLALRDGSVWVVTAPGAVQCRGGRLEPIPELSALVAGKELWAAGEDIEGRIWVAGNDLLLMRDGGGWHDMQRPLSDSELSGVTNFAGAYRGNQLALLMCRSGDVWVATRNRGVQRWHQRQWTRLTTDDGLALDDVRGLREDGEGNIWLVTNGGGVNRLKPKRLEVYSTRQGLGRHVISSLVEDRNGRLWVGTDGGGVFTGGVGGFAPFRAAPGFTEDQYVWSLCAGRDGSLWMGTFSQGIYHYKEGRVAQFTMSQGLADNWVPALMEDRDGTIWVGTFRGDLQRFDGEHFVSVRGGDWSQRRPVAALLQTRDGTIWAGTTGDGLFRWCAGQLQNFVPKDGLPSEAVACLFEDRAGTLWVGTGGGGLARFRNGAFKRVSMNNGLPNDFVLQMQEDDEATLWLGSNQGLIRLEKSALERVVNGESRSLAAFLYGKDDGLTTPQFSAEHSSLSLKAQDGALWFSLANGVVRVDPHRVAPPAPPPRIMIESISANNQPLTDPYSVLSKNAASPADGLDGLNESLSRPSRILSVPPGRNNLEIRYTAIDLTAPERVRFKYILEGWDTDWQEAEDRRMASYSHVRYGDYRFRVMGCNHEGTWNEEGAALRFRVLPHFWETWWFSSIVATALFVAVTAGVRQFSLRRLQRQLARLEQERRLQEERARIAQDLHDDLGTSLTEISYLASLTRPGTTDQVHPRLGSIVERAQRMAKSLDQIVWAVNPANDSLSSTASYLCNRAQESLRAAEIRCRLDVADDLPPIALSSEVRHNLLMAVNEAVNNVMKHARASEARLSVQVKGEQLELSVEDNGRGFDSRSTDGERNGLKNMRQRIETVGGNFTLHSERGQGTKVTFNYPLREGWRVSKIHLGKEFAHRPLPKDEAD